jgi:salicylate hydroxylase
MTFLTGEKIVCAGRHSQRRSDFAYGVIYRADLHQIFPGRVQRQPNITCAQAHKVESFAETAKQKSALHSCRWANTGHQRARWCRRHVGGIREAMVGDDKPRVSGHIAYTAPYSNDEKTILNTY